MHNGIQKFYQQPYPYLFLLHKPETITINLYALLKSPEGDYYAFEEVENNSFDKYPQWGDIDIAHTDSDATEEAKASIYVLDEPLNNDWKTSAPKSDKNPNKGFNQRVEELLNQEGTTKINETDRPYKFALFKNKDTNTFTVPKHLLYIIQKDREEVNDDW